MTIMGHMARCQHTTDTWPSLQLQQAEPSDDAGPHMMTGDYQWQAAAGQHDRLAWDDGITAAM